MSADSWTHAICGSCWNERNPDRPANIQFSAGEREPCCFCGYMTQSGIYVRGDPKVVHAKERDETGEAT